MNGIERLIPVGLALGCLAAAGCDSVRFTKVESPDLTSFSARAPTPPEPQPVTEAEPEARWQVVDVSAKAPLRKKLVAVQVAVNAGADGASALRSAATSQLMAKLMTGGFTSLVDLSSAPGVNAEVTRTGGGSTVVLSGALHQVLQVATPLRADYVLSVSFATLPASQSSKQVRYALSDKDVQEYQAS